MVILRCTGQAPCLHGQLTSNVRHRDQRPCCIPPEPAPCGVNRTATKAASPQAVRPQGVVPRILAQLNVQIPLPARFGARETTPKTREALRQEMQRRAPGCPSCWLAPEASSVKTRRPKAPWLVACPVSKAQYEQRAAPHHQASSAFSRAPMPNTSVKLTRSGMAPGPSSAFANFALHGPGAMPPRSAYLKR